MMPVKNVIMFSKGHVNLFLIKRGENVKMSLSCGCSEKNNIFSIVAQKNNNKYTLENIVFCYGNVLT